MIHEPTIPLGDLQRLAEVVGPLHPVQARGKVPRLDEWPKQATRDTGKFAEWLAESPSANWGIATGHSVDVLDTDGEKGLAELVRLEGEHGELPPTWTVTTPGGGLHTYWKPAGFATRVGVAPGNDARGVGGYVLGVGSIGANGKRYEWVPGHSPADLPLAAAPDWLVELARRKAPASTVSPAAVTWRAPEVDGITEAEIWKRLEAAPTEIAEPFKRARRGEPLFAAGEHYAGVWRAVSAARFRAPEASDATILRLLGPSIDAMRCSKHGIAFVASKLVEANEDFGRAEAEREGDRRTGQVLHDVVTEILQPQMPEDVGRGWRAANGYSILSAPGGQARLGVYKLQGDKPPKVIAPAPINIVSRGADENGAIYLGLRWLYAGAEQELIVPRAKLFGSGLQDLAAIGAPVGSANVRELQTFLMLHEAEELSTLEPVQVFTGCGWSADFCRFAIGDHVVGDTEPPSKLYMPGASVFLNALGAKGSADEQLRLCLAVRDQNPIAEAFWSAGYAAPLVAPLGLRSMCLSVWGASGWGKSAVQAVAVSPWGHPSALKVSGDSSDAGLKGELERRRDLPVWLDDTQLLNREEASERIAYVVGAEVGGARAQTDGTLRDRKTWRAVVVVSGEKPMLHHGGAAGARNRTIEVRGQPIGNASIAAQTHRGLEHHHGHSGPKFIEHLIESFVRPGRLHVLREMHSAIARALASPDGEHLRYVALLALADRLARRSVAGETDESAERRSIEVAKAFHADVTQAVVEASSTADTAYENLVAFIASRSRSFDAFASPRLGAFIPNCEEADGRTVAALYPATLAEIAKLHGFNARQVFADLTESGRAVRDADHMTKKIPRKQVAERPRAYWLVMPPEWTGAPKPDSHVPKETT